jgi:signal transduction histidine kinase/ligand-binding sensor domain-containing protein/DNA-binding response OmpR family regulator
VRTTDQSNTAVESPTSTGRYVAALVFIAISGASAQPSSIPGPAQSLMRWVHESWSVENGLPVNSINQLLQSRSGYIWAATFDGLVRFDGVRFTVFNSATSPGLPSNRIVSVREAHDGALWLFTGQHHLVRYRDGRFVHFGKDRGLAEGQVQSILEVSAGTIWVATTRGVGAIRKDRFVPVARDTIATDVAGMVERRDGSIWVAATHGGVFRIDRGDRVRRVAADSTFGGEYVARLYEDSTRTLWIATDHGLWRWRDRPLRVRGIAPDPGQQFQVFGFVSAPTAGVLYVNTQQGLYRVDSSGASRTDRFGMYGLGTRLWTDGRSIWHTSGSDVMRDGQREFALSSPSTTIVDRVQPYTITTALLDREGSLWLGTQAAGLHRLKPAIFTTVSSAEGLADRNVYPTYVDSRGIVWVGTQAKGLSRIDPLTRRVETFAPPRVMTGIFSFLEHAPGELWVGGRGFLQSCVTATMTCRYAGPPGLEQRTVFSLHRGTDGGIWVATGVGVFRVDSGRWTKFDASAGLPDAPVRAFATTRDGAVWMGTSGGGLVRYRHGRFTEITTANGLPSDLVRSLYEDADGWLWIGTDGRGLARLDPRAWARAGADRGIRQVGSRDGLFDDVIHQILEDSLGRLWMSSNRGIFWVTRSELNAFFDGRAKRVHSTGYTERDGLRNREANGGTQPAGAKGADGRLWFPTQDGVAVVDPRTVGADRMAAPILVEQIIANGVTRPPNDGGVELGVNERDVQIEYTALTFLEPANVRFRYRLDPYDAEWVDAGNRRTAFYTKVPPRRYTFRVEASGSGGGWQEPGATLAIRVVPQFWETVAFRWAAVATLGAVVLLGFRWRINNLHARAAELERVVGERTAELRGRERQLAEQNVQLATLDKAKTRFFANVSHELRTPLTLTIGPLQDLRTRVGADAQANRWVDLAMRNSQRLLRLVNQILDVAKLEAGAMKLAPRSLDLVTFVRGITSAFLPVTEQRSIALRLDTPDAISVTLDPDAIEKIVANLLSNAIKFTPPGGSIDVTLVGDTETVTFSVHDTGPGIPADRLEHVFERFYQADESSSRTQPGTGIGLSLVKELVEVQGGSVSVASNASGTTFRVTVPRGCDTALGGEGSIIADVGAPTKTDVHATIEDIAASGDPSESDGGHDDVPTLLVVDDSADLRAYIRDHFAPRFRVIEGADGADGIMLAQQHLPDVIVSDVMMPGTDGHAMLRALRASPETDFVPVILLTAQADGAQRIAGLERGADDYIVKPFEMRELDARVRNIIESRRRLRTRFAAGSAQRAGQPAVAPARPEPARSSADRAFMDKVRAVIEQHMADPEFGVTELAREAAIERSHLFRRTRDLFAEAPSDVIRRMRVAAGARLLDERSGTVADVAYAVGFNSVAYFRRCFQEAYGVTPAAYRDRSTA